MSVTHLKEKARETLEGHWVMESLILYAVSFPLILSSFLRSYIMTILLSIVTIPLFFGYVRRMMKLRNGQEDPIEEMLHFFKQDQLIGVIALQLFTSLLVFFWGVILFIPGIIAGLTYSFIHMIRVENPMKEPREILTMSREMTSGCKLEIFIMFLSFIGWGVLSRVVGFISSRLAFIIGIPITVYMLMTHIEMYYSVKGRN